MTFLLTNDDGIDAPGMQALQTLVKGEGVVVAPEREQSGCGHSVTVRQPLRVAARSPTAFAVGGTPADCVRVGLTYLYPETRLVLAGINAGGNLGVDVYMSGTVAAAREAVLLGVPSVAISHYRHVNLPIDWDLAATMASRVLAELLTHPLPPHHFWNVNLPHLHPGDPIPEIVFCPPCRQPLPVSYRIEGDEYHYTGRYEERSCDRGADVEVCFSGRIAITQLHL